METSVIPLSTHARALAPPERTLKTPCLSIGAAKLFRAGNTKGRDPNRADFQHYTTRFALDCEPIPSRRWCMKPSARNTLPGKITELQLGGVMAHVVVRVGDNLIESVITRKSAEEMNLRVGDKWQP